MSIQYISNSQGTTTGVYIPINEWSYLKQKYKGLEDDEAKDMFQWHQDVVMQRLEAYYKNPEQALDFESALDDIEKSFNV